MIVLSLANYNYNYTAADVTCHSTLSDQFCLTSDYPSCTDISWPGWGRTEDLHCHEKARGTREVGISWFEKARETTHTKLYTHCVILVM